MSQTCPHCGKELPRTSQRYGTEIVAAFFEDYGGPDKFGKDMSRSIKSSTGYGKGQQIGSFLNLLQAEDRARSRQQEIEDFSRQQELAILKEQAVYMLLNDDEFRNDCLQITDKRKLIETEFV